MNSSTRKCVGVATKCRALDQLPPADQPKCASWVHPDKPGWYLVHRNDLLVFEPEYAPTSPETFDEDASILFERDSYFPGFVSFGFVSKPGHVAHAAADGFVRLAPIDDTLDFKNAASSFVVKYKKKGESERNLSY